MIDGTEIKRGKIGKTYSRRRPTFWIWEVRDNEPSKSFWFRG